LFAVDLETTGYSQHFTNSITSPKRQNSPCPTSDEPFDIAHPSSNLTRDWVSYQPTRNGQTSSCKIS